MSSVVRALKVVIVFIKELDKVFGRTGLLIGGIRKAKEDSRHSQSRRSVYLIDSVARNVLKGAKCPVLLTK